MMKKVAGFQSWDRAWAGRTDESEDGGGRGVGRRKVGTMAFQKEGWARRGMLDEGVREERWGGEVVMVRRGLAKRQG